MPKSTETQHHADSDDVWYGKHLQKWGGKERDGRTDGK